MDSDAVRKTLDRLVHERGDDYASLSRMLGRNPTYIQQFVKRGVPRKLAEDDRRRLAAHLGVSEQELGGPPGPVGRAVLNEPYLVRDNRDYVLVPRLAGDGSVEHTDSTALDGSESTLAFQAQWIQTIATAGVDALCAAQVEGDSMHPTLAEGDSVLVDTADRRLRDGIFALKADGTLYIRRISINPVTRKVTVSSDNTVYPSWADCDPSSIDLIGRVVWAGRRL